VTFAANHAGVTSVCKRDLMSSHDLTLIVLSIIGAVLVLRLFGVVEVPLKGIFSFDILQAPILEKVLDADELRHFRTQEMSFPKVTVRLFYFEAQFEVAYEKSGKPEVRTMQEVFATPYYPTVLWECDLPEKPSELPPSALRSFLDKAKVVVQYERRSNRIVFGMRGGRFDDFDGYVLQRNVLAEVPCDASKLRALNPQTREEKKFGQQENPLARWNIIVKHEDDKMLWYASCTDVEGLVNRRRFI
jgi:hypothetical protein